MALKVLVVEDHVPTLEFMSEVLTALDAEVRAMSNSQQAATLVTQERFDGIFLDLEMPEVNGFDLACRIRESSWNRSTPIIIVTGRDEPNTMKKAFAVGGTFFLQKPVDRAKLTQLFKTARGAIFQNHRRFVRLPLRTEIVCQAGSLTVRGNSCNISQGGVLLEAGRFIEPGTKLKLTFRLPGQSATIHASGMVARVDDKQRWGIRFTTMDETGKLQIRQLIAAEGWSS